MEKAEDGFNIVAEYLGRGLFSQPQEVAVPDLTKVERRPVEDLRENISEGRLRAGERRREEVRTETESRLRSEQPSQANINIPSAARMRLEETRQSSSLSAHISSPVTRNSFRQSVSPQVGRSAVRMSPSPMVPRREDIAPANPFGETSNPFGSPDSNESLGEDNPFAESSQQRQRSVISAQV